MTDTTTMPSEPTQPLGLASTDQLGVNAPKPVVFLRFRVKGTTPKGHRGRRAKRAAFAANLKAVRASLKSMQA